MRDVIQAHELLLEYGIPHPGNNINPGTVMIGSNLRGYLFDFDHCTHIPAGEDNKREEDPRAEINTAVPYRRDKYPGSPGTSRDLESLFWLYIWVIYRHVKYDVKAGYKFNANNYDFSSEDSGSYTKGRFLRDVEIPDFDKNKPLTQLTVDLQQIFRTHLRTKDEGDHGPPPDTTHKQILEKHDLVLQLPGWPDDDASRPYDPPLTIYEILEREDRAEYEAQKEARRAAAAARRANKQPCSLKRLAMDYPEEDLTTGPSCTRNKRRCLDDAT